MHLYALSSEHLKCGKEKYWQKKLPEIKFMKRDGESHKLVFEPPLFFYFFKKKFRMKKQLVEILIQNLQRIFTT